MQALAGNAVVAEVAEDIGEVRQAVVLGTEAQVTLLVEPSCHGRAVGHQHPLPNVKFPVCPHTQLQTDITRQVQMLCLACGNSPSR